MTRQGELLGSHVAEVHGSDGRPSLNCPPNWRGPVLFRKTIPTFAQCGPQFTGMPVVIAAKHSPGRRWYRCNGRDQEIPMVAPGVDLLGSAYERDAGRWECDPGGETIHFGLHAVVLERYLHEDAHRFDLETRYAVKDDQLVNTLFMLADEMQQGLPHGTLYAEGLSMTIIGWLNGNYCEKPGQALTRVRVFSAKQQCKVRDYIDSHLDMDLSVEALAGQIGVNPALFSSLFRSTFGQTPHRYVLQMRIARAAQLLRSDRQRPIADIALATGFSNQGHLSNAFKCQMKQTPSSWRERSDKP